jgi:alkanesulfonate monooxygenase SsuD/methylene tetrahydromethanopterin reductase-like flavin-dependent oxidoreductase (luciferase family)
MNSRAARGRNDETYAEPIEGTGTMTDSTANRGARPFRFGVVAPLTTDLTTWRDRVHRIADSGYSTLLMPDVPLWQPAPAPTLAVAATLADLRIGTWVYASPFRPAWSTAWEAHSLSVLTDGRFEMGIGTGRPGIEDELRDKGLAVVSPGERLAQVRETVMALRDLDGPDLHTPVVMAVRGPKAQALAADIADTVTFAQMPGEPRDEITRVVRDFRPIRDVELAQHVAVIGDAVAPFMAPPDTDTAALHAADSLEVLPDDPAAAAEEIQRRREEIGFSYFVFGADFAETLAPVVAELAGR